jgi:hypothetical protein
MINGDARPCFGRVSNASDLKRIRVLLLEMPPMLLDIVTNIVASQDDIDVIAKAQDEPDQSKFQKRATRTRSASATKGLRVPRRF